MSKRKEEFKFDLYDRVNTPLVTEGIVTMLGVDEGGITYFIESAVDGVANKWWPESQLDAIS